MGPATRAGSAARISWAHSHDRRDALDDEETAWWAVFVCMSVGDVVVCGAIFWFTRLDNTLVIFVVR